jgi:hypothetical protein
MANMREKISIGISLAVAVLAAVMGAFVWIALPLLVLAVLLFAWALEHMRTAAFVGRLPYSNYVLKALAKLDLVLPGRKLIRSHRRARCGARPGVVGFVLAIRIAALCSASSVQSNCSRNVAMPAR